LPIHPDLAAELWCHHWTARPPRLPVMASPAVGAGAMVASPNQQLSLEGALDKG
jgi:hypothetical protein